MQINIEIESMVAEAVQNALQPAKVRDQINELVDGLVSNALRNTLRAYGDLAKDVERQIAESLPIGTKIDDLCNFSDLVRKGIATRINQLNDQRINDAIMPMVDNLLEPAPAEIKLSELVASAIDKFSDDYKRDEFGSQPTIIVEKSHGVGGDSEFYRIYIDPHEAKSKYSCAYHLSTYNGEVYSIKADGSESTEKSLFIGPFYGFDRLLVNLYTCKSKVIVDKTDFSDVYYGDSESED